MRAQFIRGGDPKESMNIGTQPNKKRFTNWEEFLDWVLLNFDRITGVKPTIKDTIPPNESGQMLYPFIFEKLREFISSAVGSESYYIEGTLFNRTNFNSEFRSFTYDIKLKIEKLEQ